MRTRRLVHRWLRIAGTITWSVIGVTFAVFFVDQPPVIGNASWLLWSAAFAAFFVLFWIDTGANAEQRPRGRRIVLLLLQSLCAFAIAGLPKKPVGFIFLTLIAAQMAGMLTLRAAAAWIVVQSAAMGWIYSQIVPAWEAQAYIAVYLGFQAFAHVVVRAALSEAAARDDLARTHVELSAKEALLAESQRLADRARIGQDLHDVLGHHLAAMSLNLEVASHLTDGDAKSHVEQARQLTQRLLDDVREVVTELRSENGYDLEEVVRRIAADMPSPAIHVDVAPEVRVVADAAKAETLIRCVQELITNAVRHAGAANLWIALTPRDGGVELAARDDGNGVDRIDRGVGLSGLEQRFARLGGRFACASARGAGFSVTAWLP